MPQITIQKHVLDLLTYQSRQNNKKATFVTRKYGSEDQSGLNVEKIQATVMGLLQTTAARIKREVPNWRTPECTKLHNAKLLKIYHSDEVLVTGYIISSLWNGKGCIFVQEEFSLSVGSCSGRVSSSEYVIL